MKNVCVHLNIGKIQISGGAVPPIFVMPIPAGKQRNLSIQGRKVLVKGDIDAWAKKLKIPYAKPPFVGGILKVDRCIITKLTRKCTSKQKLVTIGTKIKLLMSPMVPAVHPVTGAPDPAKYMGSVKVITTHIPRMTSK